MGIGNLIEDNNGSFPGYLIEPRLGEGGSLQQYALMHGIDTQPTVEILGVNDDRAQRNVESFEAVQGVSRNPQRKGLSVRVLQRCLDRVGAIYNVWSSICLRLLARGRGTHYLSS
jgi:hypothetical protein